MGVRKICYAVVINVLILSLIGCNTIEPINNSDITFSLADVSCTEAWLNIQAQNISYPLNLTINSDEKTLLSTKLNSTDSVIYIDSLLPNKSYTLQGFFTTNNQPQTTNKLTVQTLDTTSNNFTWQKYYFGGEAFSVLHDVAIVNDSDIWAVGEIYLNDSTGKPDPNAYNLVQWDGNEWKLSRIKTNACGGVVYPPIQSIFVFSSNDILFAHIDGSISHYNGIEFTNDCSLITQLNGSANKIWGVSSRDFYVVSGNGFIAHYQNGQWIKIESGTTLDLTDIWGSDNPSQILAVANALGTNFLTSIFEIKGNSSKLVSTNPINYPLSAIWFVPNLHYYVGGSGLYEKHLLSDSLWKNGIYSIAQYYVTAIRGSAVNDVFVAGSYGEFLHWNGVRWNNFINETALSSGSYGPIAIKGNLVIAVGLDNGKAVILKGIR